MVMVMVMVMVNYKTVPPSSALDFLGALMSEFRTQTSVQIQTVGIEGAKGETPDWASCGISGPR